jgi:hypothetical protein
MPCDKDLPFPTMTGTVAKLDEAHKDLAGARITLAPPRRHLRVFVASTTESAERAFRCVHVHKSNQ